MHLVYCLVYSFVIGKNMDYVTVKQHFLYRIVHYDSSDDSVNTVRISI